MKLWNQEPIKGETPEETAALVRKEKNRRMFRLLLGIVFVSGVIALVMMIFCKPTRSPKAAAKAAFEAIYSCELEDFIEATIYNADCQKELGLNLAEDLTNIETAFIEMEQWMKQTGETYNVRSVEVTEYDPFTEEYEQGIILFQNVYELRKSNITNVALAKLKVRANYKDEGGESVETTFDEEYWVYEVDGKWYAFPMIGEEEE